MSCLSTQSNVNNESLKGIFAVAGNWGDVVNVDLELESNRIKQFNPLLFSSVVQEPI